MKSMTLSAILAASALLAGTPALAQSCAARFCVDSTPIGTIWADPDGKKILLKELPPIEQYLEQIKGATLTRIAPQSGGIIDDAKLKVLQADFNALPPAGASTTGQPKN